MKIHRRSRKMCRKGPVKHQEAHRMKAKKTINMYVRTVDYLIQAIKLMM